MPTPLEREGGFSIWKVILANDCERFGVSKDDEETGEPCWPLRMPHATLGSARNEIKLLLQQRDADAKTE